MSSHPINAHPGQSSSRTYFGPRLLFPTRDLPRVRFDRRGKQGELVDRVEYHVGQAQVHVGVGKSELRQAEGYQRKARKVGFRNRDEHLTESGRDIKPFRHIGNCRENALIEVDFR